MSFYRSSQHYTLTKSDGQPVKQGDIIAVEHDWCKSFAIVPHKTISGQYVWLKSIYKRRVWVYTGFVDEPVTQYGELFDILKTI